MPFTEFKPVEPVVEPATAQKEYTKMYVKHLNITAHNPKQPVSLAATFVATREYIDADGNPAVEYKDGSEVRVVVEDLFTEAATNAQIAGAIEAVFVALKVKGIEQGKFKV